MHGFANMVIGNRRYLKESGVILDNELVIKNKYKNKIYSIFAFNDANSCERTYKAKC